MTWARLDDQFPDHPKVREVGVFGLAIQTASICYSSRYLTDGFLSWSVVDAIIANVLAPFTLPTGQIITPAETSGMEGSDASEIDWKQRMIASGLWEKTRRGVRIHDYLKYNPTRASVLEARGKLAQRVAKHRSNGNKVTNAAGNALVRAPRTPNYKDKDVDSKPEDSFGDLDHHQKQAQARELLKQVTAKIGRQPTPPAAEPEPPF